MRKDLCNVINHALDIGSHPSIITNGLLLSKETISALLGAGLREIVLSLNGIKPETHDFTRGTPGSFNQIMKAIGELRQLNSNTTIGIATVLMGYNIDEAVELVHWVKTNALSRITFQALFFETGNKAYQDEWYNDSVLWPAKDGNYSEVIDELVRLKEAGYPIANPVEQLKHFKTYFLNPHRKIPIPCKIGIHGFFVEPNGDVKLCYLFEPVGNLLKSSPKDIWNSKKAQEIRKLIKNCQLNCRLKNCNYRE
jgi:MoaA/NifB/PqqE/SkfB family radical SAM enzyme